jgi:ribosome maturation factor RimP
LNKGVTESVRGVAARVIAGRGFELVDVELKTQPGGLVLRVYVDKEGGIGLEELQSVAEETSAILDVEDPIASNYTLEVSSPGLDRPLVRESDYTRFAGRLVKLSSYEPVDSRRHWTGRLLGIEDGVVSLRLEAEGGSVARVPYAKLSHGRLEIEFPGKPASKN